MKKIISTIKLIVLSILMLSGTITNAQSPPPWSNSKFFNNSAPNIIFSTNLVGTYNGKLDVSAEVLNPYGNFGLQGGFASYQDTETSEVFTHQLKIREAYVAMPIYLFGLPRKILVKDSRKRRGFTDRQNRRNCKRAIAKRACFQSYLDGNIFNGYLRGLYIAPQYATQTTEIVSDYLPNDLDFKAYNKIIKRSASVSGGYKIAIENITFGIAYGTSLGKPEITNDSFFSENEMVTKEVEKADLDTNLQITLGISF